MENMKGTTTVGIVCSDGVVFAADKRAVMGYFIANREVEKIFRIDERMAITTAGSVGDAQTLVRWLSAEAQLYKLRTDKYMTPYAATTLISNILSAYKFFPFLVQLLIGGLNDSGEGEIYNLDPVGGVTKEKFVSTGSGSPVAFGLLEDAYKDGVTTKEAAPLALKAVSIAMKRDVGTGDGVDLVIITKEGFKRYADKEIEKLVKK
ncbi:MAG: archaeal proteasome endopeptidase complex subunit beta [Candidatus Micrarchaeia archaeon]